MEEVAQPQETLHRGQELSFPGALPALDPREPPTVCSFQPLLWCGLNCSYAAHGMTWLTENAQRL